MNVNLLNVLKQITAQYGEDVLDDARRLKALFSDLAKDEPKPLRMAFGKCVESGFYRIIKDTRTVEERREVINGLARRLRDEEGLDLARCAEALEVLAAAVFGEGAAAPAPKAAQSEAATMPAYYLSFNFRESGPFDLPTIERMIANGQITPAYYCRTSPSQEWVQAASLPEFAPLFPADSSPGTVSTAKPAPASGGGTSLDRGKMFLDWSDYATAIDAFTEAIRQDPDNAEAYFYRGKTYYKEGDKDQAIKDFTQVITLKPNKAGGAYGYRGKAYLDKDDYDRAIADFTQSIKQDPDNAEAYYNRGDAYFGQHDYNRAIADFTQAIKLDPDDVDAYHHRGVVYYIEGDNDRAIADYTQSIKLNPDNPEAYCSRGGAYSAKDDYEQAIKDYTQAIRLNPDYAFAYANRGVAYNEKGQKKQAIADLKKAVSLNPNNTWTQDRLREIRGK